MSSWCHGSLSLRRLLRHPPHSSLPSTPRRPISIAVIGSGPAGFYVTASLLRSLPAAHVTIIDAAPVPFGLVRYGVAPDHPEVKNCIHQFTTVMENNVDRVSFVGNVRCGTDVSVAVLRQCYDILVMAYGAAAPNTMHVEGETKARNCMTASAFVGWYNGMPEHEHLDVDLARTDTAVVVGNGNVALDVARVLLTDVDVLRKTDLTDYALQALAESRIRNVHIVGRRAALQVAFTIKELREIVNLPDNRTIISPDGGCSNIDADLIARLPRRRKRLTQLMVDVSNRTASPSATSSVHMHFLRSPTAVLCDDRSFVSGVRLCKNRLHVSYEGEEDMDALINAKATTTEDEEEIECGLVVASIGYKSLKINGLPFDDRRNVIPTGNDGCQVMDPSSSSPVEGVYATGWCATGPRGVIADTQIEAKTCAAAITRHVNDGVVHATKAGEPSLLERLTQDNVRWVGWPEWLAIDEFERRTGAEHGKPREKITTNEQMLKLISKTRR